MGGWLLLVLLAFAGVSEPDRRSVRFAEGQAQGAIWMLECQDLWDSSDPDEGVYFHLAKTTEEARREVCNVLAHPRDLRVLGVYKLDRDLPGQTPPMSARQFLRDQNSSE